MASERELRLPPLRNLTLTEAQYKAAAINNLSRNFSQAFIHRNIALNGGANLRPTTIISESIEDHVRLEQLRNLGEAIAFIQRRQEITVSLETLRSDMHLFQKVYNHCLQYQEMDHPFELDSNTVLGCITGDEYYRLIKLQNWLKLIDLHWNWETLQEVDSALSDLKGLVIDDHSLLEEATKAIMEQVDIDAELGEQVEEILTFFERYPYA